MPTWEMQVAHPSGQAFTTTITRWFHIAGFITGNISVEAEAQDKVFSSNTWANLYTVCTAWTTNNLTLTSRVGAAPGAQTVTVTGTGIFQDTTNSDSLVSGNLINWQWSRVTGGSVTLTLVGSTLQDAATNTTLQLANDLSSAGGVPFGLTRFAGICGRMVDGVGSGMSLTETNVQYTIRRATTYTNLRAYCNNNSWNANTLWRFRVDAGNGNQLLTIGAGATGVFEDTTNSDVVVIASKVNYQADTTASASGSGRIVFSQVTHISTGREMAAQSTMPGTSSTDNYYLAEGAAGGTLTETDVQLAARAAFTAKNLMVNITAHGAAASNIFLRVNTANSALTVNVPSSSTGIFEDTTNQVSVAIGGVYNSFRDGGGESITIAIIGMEQVPDDAISGGGKGYPSQMHNQRHHSRQSKGGRGTGRGALKVPGA